MSSILEEGERLGKNRVSSYEVQDFLNYCVDLGLADINYSGSRYTWSNGHVWSKIDRAMCNQQWLSDGLFAKAHFYPPDFTSDHSPCIVSLFDMPRKPRPSFMFFNMWVDHDSFMNLVQQRWNTQFMGTKQFTLLET